MQEDIREHAIYIEVSAWIDGEAEGDLPGVLATPQGRQAWDTYHLIGDTLRSSDLAMPASDAFQARVLRALEAEPAILAPSAIKKAPKARQRLRMALSGLAVAAAVAAVAWMVQPYLGAGNPEGGRVVAEAESSGSDSTATLDEASLRDYLEAHRQFTGPTAVRQASYDVGTNH